MLLIGSLACCGDGGVTPNPTKVPTVTVPSGPTLSPTPTPCPSPTATSPLVGEVVIWSIKYKGIVPYTEADEYVTILNKGDDPVNMYDWVLMDETDGYPSLTFDHYILQPHYYLRIYTNEFHTDALNFQYEEGNIWNNSHPDVAALYDGKGRLVAFQSYEIE